MEGGEVAVCLRVDLVLQDPQRRVSVHREVESFIPFLVLNPVIPGDVCPPVADGDFALRRQLPDSIRRLSTRGKWRYPGPGRGIFRRAMMRSLMALVASIQRRTLCFLLVVSSARTGRERKSSPRDA